MKRQVDTNKTKQVRIDATLHSQLKVRAAQEGSTIRTLIEREFGFAVTTDDATDQSKETVA